MHPFKLINKKNMQVNEANIEIIRKDKKLLSVSISMPIWDKTSDDNFITVNIPLLGIKTFAENEVDASVAIKEAVKAFCINSEKFGKGIESELKVLGWGFNERMDDLITMSYSVSNSNSVIDQIMQTGEQFAEKLDLAYS